MCLRTRLASACCPAAYRRQLDIQSGDILQSVNVELQGTVFAILADDDEIYIASYSRVVVLRYAGAEA